MSHEANNLVQTGRRIMSLDRASIEEVARYAGVSKSTVSNAFSGRRPVSTRMKEKVLDAASRLRYRPHFAAQVLARRQTQTIGALVRAFTDQYGALHLQAIEEAVAARGYSLSVGVTGDDPAKTRNYLDNFVNGLVDGVLVMTSNVSDEQILELVEHGFPVGIPNRIIPGHEEISSVYVNMQNTFRRLLEYLYDLGHREFGFLSTLPSEVPERHQEMYRFAQEKGLAFGPDQEINNMETVEEAEAAAIDLLKRNPQITAIVCTNDVLGVGALMGAHEMGLNVPGDISVTGFDDVPISRCCIPRLTTAKIPIAELAKVSVNHLLDRIEGKSTRSMTRMSVELIIRGSTGPARKK